MARTAAPRRDLLRQASPVAAPEYASASESTPYCVLMIAEEEKKIRQDPVGAASKLISKVFGAIGK